MEGQQEAKEKRGCFSKHSRGFGVGQEEEDQGTRKSREEAGRLWGWGEEKGIP